MLTDLRRIITGSLFIVEDEINAVYAKIAFVLFMTLGFILVMWGINITGMKEVNYLFFFLGGILLLIKLFKPRVVAISALAGTAAAGLLDTDLSQGAFKGINTLGKVVLGILFGFFVMAGLLSTWSFANSPFAFFPIAAMVLTLVTMSLFFGLKGTKRTVTIVTLYAIGVILYALWTTFDPAFRESVSTWVSSAIDTTTTSPQYAGRVVAGRSYSIGTNWLIFQQTEGECIWFPPTTTGFEWHSDPDEYRIRSEGGDRVLSFRVYRVGEADGYGNVCGGSTVSARK